MPLWFRAIHVLDAPRYLTLGYNMMKPFLSKEDQVDKFRCGRVETEDAPAEGIRQELRQNLRQGLSGEKSPSFGIIRVPCCLQEPLL